MHQEETASRRFGEHELNIVASDRVPIDRYLPDYRDEIIGYKLNIHHD